MLCVYGVHVVPTKVWGVVVTLTMLYNIMNAIIIITISTFPHRVILPVLFIAWYYNSSPHVGIL